VSEPKVSSLSLVIITLNEEAMLAECLRSASFAGETVVVDSGSTDRTREIAVAHGATVSTRTFDNFANQKNAAIDLASGDWLLLLDADERVTPELEASIRTAIVDPASPDGFYIRRDNYLFGGRLRFGANANDKQLRLIRGGKGRFEGLVHERLGVSGSTGDLKGALTHYSSESVAEYRKKLPLFCSLDAEQAWKRGERPTFFRSYLKPFAAFVYYYFFKLGFLDGSRGLLYQLLAANYLFSKYARLRRLYRDRGPASPQSSPLNGPPRL